MRVALGELVARAELVADEDTMADIVDVLVAVAVRVAVEVLVDDTDESGDSVGLIVAVPLREGATDMVAVGVRVELEDALAVREADRVLLAERVAVAVADLTVF